MGLFLGSRGKIFVPSSVVQLPIGVTLQAIDGETMLTPTVMSHSYYSGNNFTKATSANPSFPTVNWDDPNFFPLGVFFGVYPADESEMVDLGLNVAVAVTGTSDYSGMIPAQLQAFSNGSGPYGTDWEVGMHLDEPATVAAIQTFISGYTAAQWTGRMFDLTGTINYIIAGDLGGTPISTLLAKNNWTAPGGGNRSTDSFSADIYWFAYSGNSNGLQAGGNVLSVPMSFSSTPATTDQIRRGSHYGNMIDIYRSYVNGQNVGGNGNSAVGTNGATGRIPMWSLPENYDGLWTPTPYIIQPTELNWAVWSSIIHGARGIDYFTYTDFAAHGSGFNTAIYSGQSISIYNQAKATNALIKTMASVINSPAALGYLTSITPHGYIFPTVETNWLNGGVEAVAKWNGTNFYIIATTRESESTTNLSATFNIVNTGATTVTVINENRTIPITNGGTKFVDTFANAWTVHIYRIN